ncbi:MAG: peptidylprolyl isomerase [Planctomycetes bacterium]|nr:peptidylprolyl isomerase [Planctomycetota bacterium]
MSRWPIKTQSPAEQTEPSAVKLFFERCQPYQNIIFFIVLVVCLLVILLFWRGYRQARLDKEVWRQLPRSNSVQALLQMAKTFKDTPALPRIRLKLAAAYENDKNVDAAKKIYEELLAGCPQLALHQQVVAASDTNTLKELKTNLAGSCPRYNFHLLIDDRLRNISLNQSWDLQVHFAELRSQRNYPQVTVRTSQGDFRIELFEDEAPNTVANFIQLVENKFYQGTPFAERREDLGLCLGSKGITPTHTIALEKNDFKHDVGAVGMLRELDSKVGEESESSLNSAAFKFYIALKPQPHQDGKYAIFGRVIDQGMEVVKKLKKGDPITEIVVERKRNHSYEPKTIPVGRE